MVDPDRALGAYIGAAIGDAMGGPVEGQHAARIRKHYGEITGLLPYRKPPGLMDLHPGYALRPDAGCVTDDTFIRADLTRFILETEPPRTPAALAEWMLANADFSVWWPPAIEALRRVERGEVTAEEAGLSHGQGGGVGWWTPVGVLHGGSPKDADAEAASLCRIWKAPLERDLLGAVQAGVAEALREGATFDSTVSAMLDVCGPLARRLLGRGAQIARAAADRDELVRELYASVLVSEAPTEVDAPVPEPIEPVDYTDDGYATSLLAEQVPLAVAAFVFGRGEARVAVPTACMIGRDADTVATTVGSWCGGLSGESGLPAEWVETVCRVNEPELDIRGLAGALVEKASKRTGW